MYIVINKMLVSKNAQINDLLNEKTRRKEKSSELNPSIVDLRNQLITGVLFCAK